MAQAFEVWAQRVVGFQPELIIVDLGGYDVACPSAPIDEIAAELLVHLTKIFDHLPASVYAGDHY